MTIKVKNYCRDILNTGCIDDVVDFLCSFMTDEVIQDVEDYVTDLEEQ